MSTLRLALLTAPIAIACWACDNGGSETGDTDTDTDTDTGTTDTGTTDAGHNDTGHNDTGRSALLLRGYGGLGER